MAWTAPRTWSAGELVTATMLNAHVRDNELILKTSIADLGGLTPLVGGSAIATLPSGVISSQINVATTSGTGATDIHSYAVPAGALARNGDCLGLYASGTMTSNSNLKTFTVVFGATSIQLNSNTGVATGYEMYARVLRTGAATQILTGWMSFDAYTISFGAVVRGAPAETLANSIVLKTRHTMAVSGTISEEQFQVEFKAAP